MNFYDLDPDKKANFDLTSANITKAEETSIISSKFAIVNNTSQKELLFRSGNKNGYLIGK